MLFAVQDVAEDRGGKCLSENTTLLVFCSSPLLQSLLKIDRDLDLEFLLVPDFERDRDLRPEVKQVGEPLVVAFRMLKGNGSELMLLFELVKLRSEEGVDHGALSLFCAQACLTCNGGGAGFRRLLHSLLAVS